jgi:hypothetical protein
MIEFVQKVSKMVLRVLLMVRDFKQALARSSKIKQDLAG